VVDLRARVLRQDNKSYTGADEGRIIDDSVSVLGNKDWAVKALLHATRSNLESYWRAKESQSFNACVSSLELVVQSVLKLSELYRQVRVERVEETQKAERTQKLLPVKMMLQFLAELRATMGEEFEREETTNQSARDIRSRDPEPE